MQVRPYVPADWRSLCEIHDAARKQELQASGLLDAFVALEHAASNEGLFDGTVLVAEEDGTVLGFVGFNAKELTWLYVHPSRQRRGVARALVSAALDITRGPLELDVLEGNESALRFYLGMGFRVVERRSGKLAGNESFAASGYVMRHSGVSPGALVHRMRACRKR